MNNQLSNIAVQYRKFSKGQYIEHTQFNEFLDYFEDQDRLSRVMLQGVGVVCGLKPNLIYANKILNSIQLSQGVALTTDGDLLTLNNTNKVSEDLYVSDLKTINIESKNYTHFKVYDNYKLKYPSFYDDDIRQIELWELATVQEANTDFQPINNLPSLDDKYLLLYLEDYEKEVKPCRGVDCDNHGVQQIRNLKVLVTTARGIANIIGEDRFVLPDPITGVVKPSRKDRIQPHPLFIDDILKPVKQERVIVERLILNKEIQTPFSSSNLKDLYVAALQKSGYGQVLFERINAISQIMGIQGVNYLNFKITLDNFLSQNMGFQYAYDVVQDLTDTYSEIIKLLPKAFTKCLPDLLSFPKHIMLGKLIPKNQLDFSRHQFYNSPVLDDEKTTQRVKLLVNRFIQQAQSFRYPAYAEGKSQIKITPSQKLSPLSNKAVPFYYQISEDFLKTWNFDKTSNRSSTYNLAYDTAWLSQDAPIQDPLSFNIDKNSFFNIEGHQGMSLPMALEQIKEIRNKQQLAFDIMAVSLDELVNNQDLEKAYFNEYVEKHPGLEHRRGVERKGTFVIIYEAIGRDTRVVADFSLPYVCCTPKTEVKLSLPTAVICSESGPVPFTVFPVSGEVKAVVDANLNGGVVLDKDRYFFDPKSVSQSLYGKEIGFTVNGKSTNCHIKVVPQPKVNIEVVDVFYPEPGSVATTVNFKVSGDNIGDYKYSWDFWSNDGFITLNPDKKGNISYTFYNLIPTRVPAIKVNISGNGCTQNIELRDWYPIPTITINRISFPKGNCCEGNIPLPTMTANAGGPQTITLPLNYTVLRGFGTSTGTSAPVYSWRQISGTNATLSGSNQPTLTVMDLVEGEYEFELTVKDASTNAYATDVAKITVLPEPMPVIEIVKKADLNLCEVTMVVKVNVPKGENRIVRVFNKGKVPTTEFKDYTGIKSVSDFIVEDGFVVKIEASQTFGMFLNVNGFMYGSQTDNTRLTLQVTDDSGVLYDEIALTTNHNPEFNSKEMNRCISPNMDA